MRHSGLRSVLVLGGAILASGCWGNSNGVYLTAPFNQETELAQVSAVWRDTGEERSFADASRLEEPQVRFQYRVDVDNLLHDKLYVQLGKLELLDDDGLSLGAAREEVRCVLGPGKKEGILKGSVWVSKGAARKVDGFGLDRFGVPLSERGRAMYREWLLQGRPEDGPAIDAEIAGYASAPACP